MKDTILIVLIEILYLYNFSAHWLVWCVILFVTLIIGFSLWITKQNDREIVELIDELYKKRNETKDTKDA